MGLHLVAEEPVVIKSDSPGIVGEDREDEVLHGETVAAEHLFGRTLYIAAEDALPDLAQGGSEDAVAAVLRPSLGEGLQLGIAQGRAHAAANRFEVGEREAEGAARNAVGAANAFAGKSLQRRIRNVQRNIDGGTARRCGRRGRREARPACGVVGQEGAALMDADIVEEGVGETLRQGLGLDLGARRGEAGAVDAIAGAQDALGDAPERVGDTGKERGLHEEGPSAVLVQQAGEGLGASRSGPLSVKKDALGERIAELPDGRGALPALAQDEVRGEDGRWRLRGPEAS